MEKMKLGILGEIWLPLSEEIDCLGELEKEICERTSTHLILRSKLFYENKTIKTEIKTLRNILKHINRYSPLLTKPYRIALSERFIKGGVLLFVSYDDTKQHELYNSFKNIIDNIVKWTFDIEEINPACIRHFDQLIREVDNEKTLDFNTIELESISLCELWNQTLDIDVTYIISPLLGGTFVGPVTACLNRTLWEYINYSMYDRKVNVSPTYRINNETCLIVDDNVGSGKSMHEISKILAITNAKFLAFEMNWSKFIRAEKGIVESYDSNQFLRCSPLWYRHFENLKIWREQFTSSNFEDYPDYLSYINSCFELTNRYRSFLPKNSINELSKDLLYIKSLLSDNNDHINSTYIEHQINKTGE